MTIEELIKDLKALKRGHFKPTEHVEVWMTDPEKMEFNSISKVAVMKITSSGDTHVILTPGKDYLKI